jgi:hypothetical protein
MTVGTVRTQGTELFFVDNSVTTSDPDLIKLACPTGIQGLGGAKDQIETTCLDTVGDKEFAGGLGNPGVVTVPFNLIPREYSHQNLLALKKAGEILSWIACLSEGATQPTIDTDGVIAAPSGRSSFLFQGYIADVNIDIANNEIVRGTLTIQRSGDVTFNAYVPA